MRLLPVLALLLVSALWGGHAVVGKTVEEQLSPLALTVWRFTFGALCYIPLFPRLIRMRHMPRRTFWQLVLTGLFWAVLYPLFFYQSLRYTTPVESLLIINTSPLIVALFGWLVLRERILWIQGVGIGVSFVGVAWTMVGQWGAKASIVGIVFVLIAASAFAAYTVSSRSLSRKLSMFDMVAATSVIGAIELWIISIFSGQVEKIWYALAPLNLVGWGEFLYVAIIVSTVSYIFYAYGLRETPSAISSALTFYPQIIFAALIQWVWLDIRPTWNVLFSAILILGGVVIMHLPVRTRDNLSH